MGGITVNGEREEWWMRLRGADAVGGPVRSAVGTFDTVADGLQHKAAVGGDVVDRFGDSAFGGAWRLYFFSASERNHCLFDATVHSFNV